MKNNPVFEQLREASWRRKLTPAEEQQLRSFLAAHPEAQADWQAEAALTESLNRLPSAPVPSNFTARVLAAIDREAGSVQNTGRHGWAWFHWRLRWLPRVAVVLVVLGAGFLTYRYDLMEKRKARAQSLMTVSELPPLTSPEMLENFDAIQALGQAASADEELLRLMQ